MAPQAQPTAIGGGELVEDVVVRGNAKVESDAILGLLKTHKGGAIQRDAIQSDIRTLFDLGYFSSVRVYKRAGTAGRVVLIIEVKEKPAITSVSYEGNHEVTDDNIKDKLETKLYTIVNEAAITADVRMIEKQYAEKGYYLAKVTYTLDPKGANDVGLTFHVD